MTGLPAGGEGRCSPHGVPVKGTTRAAGQLQHPGTCCVRAGRPGSALRPQGAGGHGASQRRGLVLRPAPLNHGAPGCPGRPASPPHSWVALRTWHRAVCIRPLGPRSLAVVRC